MHPYELPDGALLRRIQMGRSRRKQHRSTGIARTNVVADFEYAGAGYRIGEQPILRAFRTPCAVTERYEEVIGQEPAGLVLELILDSRIVQVIKHFHHSFQEVRAVTMKSQER